ncbi:MAG TPA: hypothetical protein P5104_03290 [Bacteroidales bacterium]|nr:hypothetical protein [Bacteroidales bacterium]
MKILSDTKSGYSMKKESRIFILIAGLLWLYLIVRAILVQPMHDEIATFFTFVQTGRFLPYQSEWTTNNHLLNSLLTFISFQLFGSSPLALRLPTLLFFPLFCFFLWKISGYIQSSFLRWSFLISTLFIHTFLEFFALSRGYGMAMTLLTGSIWFTIKSFNGQKLKTDLFALLLIILSVSAILININSMIVILGLLLLNRIFLQRKSRTVIWLIVFFGAVPLAAAVIYLLDLNAAGRLDFGGSEGFWATSAKELTQMLVKDHSKWFNTYILITFTGILSGFGLLLYKAIIQKNLLRFLLHPRWIMFYLLIGNIIGFIIEHHLFGVLYPGDRTSMQFILFFTGSLFFIVDTLPGNSRPFIIIVLLPLLIFPVQFLTSMNFSKISVENEAIPDRFFHTIKNEGEKENYQPVIQGYKGRELRWAYLNYRERAQALMIHCSSYPDDQADFQIVYPIENPSWLLTYDSVDSDAASGLYLLKRKEKPLRQFIKTQEFLTSQNIISDEYKAISEGTIDTCKNQSIFASFDMVIQSPVPVFESWIVFTIRDNSGNELRYERIPLNWYNHNWQSGTDTLRTGLLINRIPENSARYLIYIWNMRKTDFKINHLSLTLYNYAEAPIKEKRTNNFQ